MCSFGAADLSRYSLIGTKGTLLADPAFEYAESIRRRVVIGGKTRAQIFPKNGSIRVRAGSLVYFSGPLKDKDAVSWGTEGLMDVRIVQAAYESIRTERSVLLGETIPKKRPAVSQQIRRPAHAEPEVVRVYPPSRGVA
jgi:predicted dehydrogenase